MQFVVHKKLVFFRLQTAPSIEERTIFKEPELFCDGTRLYGVPAPFLQVKKKIIGNVYY